jgi:DNA (cytosine-5)-methyltransferase 1
MGTDAGLANAKKTFSSFDPYANVGGPRLLDVFCGAGGASMGYHRAGFDVWGVDVTRQPSYPFPCLLQDWETALREQADAFDAFHASPPCQRWTIGNRVHDNAADHPDYLTAVRALLRRTGKPFIIENVVGAPLVRPLLLCGTMFGLKVFRHRLFETNIDIWPAPVHRFHDGGTGAHRGYSTATSGRNGYVCVAGHNFTRDAAADAMGINWMLSRRELANAIPPAYTEYLGQQLRAHLAHEPRTCGGSRV